MPSVSADPQTPNPAPSAGAAGLQPTARELWVAFAVAFAVLAWGASPAHFWLDSGELAAAGYELGVMHPPGTPGLVLLLRVSAWVPIGPLGLRMALVGCALGAGSVVLLGSILARHGAGIGLRWGAAAWVLAGLTFVRQCRVVEIYALATMLLMVTLWGFDPAIERDRRIGPRLVGTFAAVWAAWCFGDLRLVLAPLVIVAWVADARRGRAWTRWAPPIVVMASATIVTLPLASEGGPWMDWGNPETGSSLWAHLQAQSIRDAFAHEILPASSAMWWLNATGAVSRVAQDLGAPGLVLAVLALAGQGQTRLWAGRTPTRADRQVAWTLAWIVAVEALYIVGINPMGGTDRQTGMVLAPVAALAVGRILAGWLAQRQRLAWGILPLAGAVIVAPPLLIALDDPVTTRSWGPHAWLRGALAQLPPGTLVLSQSDDLAAGLAFASVVEGARPDIVTAPAQHLHKTPPDADARLQAPWLAARGATGERGRIVAAIESRSGPVAIEHAATTLMARVPFWSDQGGVPLAIAGSEHVPTRPTPDEEVERWLRRLPSAADRRRLAVALSQRAHGVVKVEGDGALAVEFLRVSVQRVTEEQPAALVTLGALLGRAGDSASAIALTRRALELEPGRSAALRNLALYLASDPATQAEAVALAERAVALRPWERKAWSQLARVRDMVGDAAGAAEAKAKADALVDGR